MCVLHFTCLGSFKLMIKRYIPNHQPSADVTAGPMVKCVSMTKNNLNSDACTLLALLRRDEDSLNDAGRQLVKQNRKYACDVFMHEVDGWTPFHAFVLRGARKMVKLCLKAGVDVNLTMGSPDGVPGGCSALHLAAHRGDVSIIDVLISNGVDLNVRDKNGKTPVMYASLANNSLAVRKLQRAGADMTGCELNSKHSPEDMTSSPIKCILPFVCSGGRR
ncbi:E3 ubiquitin-protein ligase mind-bomb-like isoform X2 [Dreissena polymorpha]|uniref:E3 ubiquitin-protein ligase mind-bomb-like isoform X2 n=1 Tax=Dreissena polymorpha TaxID=45954 RepID=UPI0022654B73|nr:E3 ubiquitin-protein ligase mind-bomb-like isoform X2 [Dreissena polymorpha]